MDIRFLDSLIIVIEKGSIAEAARMQSITPAAVSQRIQALEREFNCQLLSRLGHKAKPTEACLNIISRAKKLIDDSKALMSGIDTSGLSGTFRIGAISTALTTIIPKALIKLGELAPKTKLNIKPGTSASLFEAMLNEQLDAAIIVKPNNVIPKYFTCQTIRVEPLGLLSKNKINGSMKNAIENNPYIRYDPFSWGGQLAEKYIRDQQIIKNSMCDLDALETITILVSEGLGVSLVPYWNDEFLIEPKTESPRRTKLYFRSIEEPKYHRELVLITSRHTHRPQLIKMFSELVIKSKNLYLK